MTSIHTNQKTCGRSIIDAFTIQAFYHVLLLAQMQMGKSGTYWYVILKMLFGNYNIKNVLIISGNREKELFEQVKEDKKKYTEWFLNQRSIRESCSKEKIELMRKVINSRIKIVWGGDLKRVDSISDNTLIVWDESHFAQSRENKPFEFFEKNGLSSILDGSEENNERNISLLTVSATPFSELVLNDNKTSCKTIRLEPDTNYYGIEHYRKKDVIKSSFSISLDTRDMLKNVFVNHKNEQKYIIVRVSDNKEQLNIVQSICTELNILCKQYNSKKKEIEIEELNDMPEKLTIIVISGMLRMGKVLPKDHISVVFESSTKNNSRKVDTGFQGLLGRMCGYTSREGGFDVTIYIEENLIQEVDEYIETYKTDAGPVTGKAMNVRAEPPFKRQPNLYNVLPISIDEEGEFLTAKGNIYSNKLTNWLKQNVHKIGCDEATKVTLLNLINSTETKYVRKNADKTSNSVFKHMIDNVNFEYNKEIAYKTIEKTELCLVSYPSFEKQPLWLIFRDDENLPGVEQEKIGNYTEGLYVLNRCVFKNIEGLV